MLHATFLRNSVVACNTFCNTLHFIHHKGSLDIFLKKNLNGDCGYFTAITRCYKINKVTKNTSPHKKKAYWDRYFKGKKNYGIIPAEHRRQMIIERAERETEN